MKKIEYHINWGWGGKCNDFYTTFKPKNDEGK